MAFVFEQDVERGERSVTARDKLLQIELVRFAQFAWHAVALAKEGRSRPLVETSESHPARLVLASARSLRRRHPWHPIRSPAGKRLAPVE